jgi:ABC-type transporter Mla maintaining outer membrane lipid asymmetry ATPase subunit MlaF
MNTAISSRPLIEMCAVTATAMKDPDRVVVEGANWSVAPGDYWVVAGLHDSGKSDFLLTAGGLLTPALGAYRFCGEAIPIFEGARLAMRLRLGLVFDGGHLLNQLTIEENVALPLRYHRNFSNAETDERVQVALDLTGLTHYADRTPSAVGRNWQKRAGLARALVLQPDILLLDSPLSGLDARHANWWLRFLEQLSHGHDFFGGKPITLVATTENLRPWKGRARQFALLKDRQFVVLGGWAEVERSSEPIVREMLAAELLAGATKAETAISSQSD